MQTKTAIKSLFKTTLGTLLVGCALSLAGGCDAGDEEFLEGADDELVESEFRGPWGGVALNTGFVDAAEFNYLDTSKQAFDGIRFDSVEVFKNGAWLELTDVWAVNGELHGEYYGHPFSGFDFLDSKWRVESPANSGNFRTITIESVKHELPSAITPNPNQSIFNYSKTYRYSFELEGGAPICELDDDGESAAVVLSDIVVNKSSGVFSAAPNKLFFACTSGAPGKAVKWGYKPWFLGLDGFQAAVRAVRADYCGTGHPYTTTGQAVQLKDDWAIQDFGPENLPTEAGWGPDGATCLTKARAYSLRPRLSCALPLCPEDPIAAGAELWTRSWDAEDM